jgi:4-methyl-5(b-hydroxyethyl)-thiazole monophosphate biosynthesis
MVSISNEKVVEGAHGITVIADQRIKEIYFASYDALTLPGGMPGTLNLGACEILTEALKEHSEKGKLVTAICAAPSVLGKLGLLKGKKACCYPGFEEQLEGANISTEKVEVDRNMITSRGLGTAIDFGLAMIKVLKSEELADKIAKGILA